MAASTPITFAALTKRRYTSQKVEDLTLADRPFLALTKKDTSFSGETLTVPMIHGRPQGTSSDTHAQAQTSASNSKSKRFLVDVGRYFGSVSIGSEIMLRSRDNPGAFLRNKIVEIDGLYETLADDIYIHSWGNGGGALGRRSGALSGNIVTLTDKAQVHAFELDMRIVASDADGSGGSDALRSGSSYVTAIDYENGKITLEDASDIGTFTANDYLFRQGEFKGDTSTPMVVGVQQYVYSTSTSVPDLWGMVRTSDPTRLAGCRVPSADVSALTYEDRIKLLLSRMAGRLKSKVPTHGFLNPEDWQQLEGQLQSRGIRSLDDESTRFGFKTLSVMAGGAECRIYADRACPSGTFFGLRMDNWTMTSMEELIHPLMGDGLTLLRNPTTNDFEYRLESFCQLYTNAPLWQGRVPLT